MCRPEGLGEDLVQSRLAIQSCGVQGQLWAGVLLEG